MARRARGTVRGRGAQVTPRRAGAMGPELRAARERDAVHDPTSRWEIRFCEALFVVALVAGAVLVGAGALLPPVGAVLVLAVLVALSVNLGALFPSEFTATADVAMLFAAVVGFATDAPLLGAFAIGMLMGPLDVVHWRQRLFYRMAYNSGAQGLCGLLAAVTYLALAGTSTAVPIVLASAMGAALVWTVADACLITLVLVRRGGTTVAAAARHVLLLDALAVPLAAAGAGAGLLARDVGWWAAVLALAPLPFVPDVVLVRTRRLPLARIGRLLALPLLVAALVAVGLLMTSVSPGLLVIAAVGSVLVGSDVVPRAIALVAPAVVGVALAGAIVDGRAGLGVCVLAMTGVVLSAAVVAGGSWVVATRAWAVGTISTLVGGAVVVGTVWSDAPSLTVLWGAALGATAFVAVDLAFAPARRADVLRAAWSLPVVVAVVADAVAWRATGSDVAGLAFLTLVATTVRVVGRQSAPAWTSRASNRARTPAGGARVALTACALVACGLAGACLWVSDPAVPAALTVSATSIDVALAAGALRQWHFAPRRRLVDALVVALALGGVLGAVAPLAFAGRAGVVVAVVLVVLGMTAAAWPLAARADRAARRQRRPESRSTRQ
jgi:hypothetical protein